MPQPEHVTPDGPRPASDESVESWERVSSGWERRRPFLWQASRGLSERLVELLDPQPGDTVLELAAGPGDTGFLAAERIGSSGRLVSTDISPAMVAAAERRASELGLSKCTLPAAISRRLVTAGLFLVFTRASPPFMIWRARLDARTTSAKRLSSRTRQSSTVTRATVVSYRALVRGSVRETAAQLSLD